MTNTETVALLESKGACAEAKDWVKSHPRWGSAKLWQACPRGDWLLWIAGRIGSSREPLVMAVIDRNKRLSDFAARYGYEVTE